MTDNQELRDRGSGRGGIHLESADRARALGLTNAPAGRRSLALGIDAVILILLATPAVIVGTSVAAIISTGKPLELPRVEIVLAVVSVALTGGMVIAQLMLHGRRGWTIGKLLTGVRSINTETFEPPGFWRVVLRALVLVAGTAIVPLVGGLVLLLSGIWDIRGRSILDRVGANWAVDSRLGLDPLDAKAMRMARKSLETPAIDRIEPFPSLATGAVSASALTLGTRSRAAVVSGGSSVGGINALVASQSDVSLDRAGRPGATVDSPTAAPAAPTPALPSRPSPALHQPDADRRRDDPRPIALVAEDGARVEVGTHALVGRNPSARREEPEVSLVALDDPTFSVSKTHAEIRSDLGGIWIVDRGSSNGTTVLGAAGDSALLVPGESMRVELGTTVALGDRVFTIAAGRSTV